MTSDDTPLTPGDGLDPLFAALRAEPPAGLEAAILAAVADEGWVARVYREDMARAARAALRPLTVALAAAVLLVAGLILSGAGAEQSARPELLALSTSQQGDASAWLLGVEEQP